MNEAPSKDGNTSPENNDFETADRGILGGVAQHPHADRHKDHGNSNTSNDVRLDERTTIGGKSRLPCIIIPSAAGAASPHGALACVPRGGGAGFRPRAAALLWPAGSPASS